jgi:hypothetical protein
MKAPQKARPAVHNIKVEASRPQPPGMGRWRQVYLGRILAASLLACTIHPGLASAKAPLWWSDPKTEDSEFLYFTASAEACQTEQEARDVAFLNAQKHISSQLAGLRPNVRLRNTSFAGVDEVDHPTEHGPKGWSCWVMVSYPKTLYYYQATNIPPPGPRRKVLVAPFAFDAFSLKDFSEVIDKYRKKGYGLGLWETIDDALEDSPDFEPDTLPSKVMNEITAALDTGTVVTGDIPDYLLVPNANFFEFVVENLRMGVVTSNTHYHASVHLALYHRENGRWRLMATAQEDKVDTDELEATNTGTRQAVQKLLERWRAKQAAQSLDEK